MYNGTNVQPQMNNTGRGGSNNGEPKAGAQPFSSAELPAPQQAGTFSVPPTPVPTPPPLAPMADEGDNHWIHEVEQLFDRTAQNPRQRAEEFSELRRRYQQDVLGIKPAGREESV